MRSMQSGKPEWWPQKATSKDGSSSGVAVASRLHIGLGKSAAGDLPVSEKIRNRFGIVHVEGGVKGGFPPCYYLLPHKNRD